MWRSRMKGAPIEKYGLTMGEACACSGVGKTKLYEEINAGKLKAHKAGKRTIILPDDLRDYLSSLPLMVDPAQEGVPTPLHKREMVSGRTSAKEHAGSTRMSRRRTSSALPTIDRKLDQAR